MKMKTLISLFIISTLLVSQVKSAYVTTGSACSTVSTVKTLTFKVHKTDTSVIGQVYGNGGYDNCCLVNCDTTLVTGSGTSADPYVLTRTQSNVGTCGGSYVSSILTLTVVVMKASSSLHSEDTVYTASCNFSTLAAPTISITSKSLESSLKTVNGIIPEPGFGLYKDSGATLLTSSTSISLGEQLTLRLTVPSFVQPTYPGVRATKCDALSDDSSVSVALTDSNGCKDANGIFSSGFTGTGTTAADFKAESPAFKAFRMQRSDGSTSSGVSIRCMCTYDTLANSLGDQCKTTRRRRSLGLLRNHTTFVVQTSVFRFIPYKERVQSQPKDGAAAAATTHGSGPVNGIFVSVPTIVWIGVVTILCSTIALLAMAVVYLLRSRDEREKNKQPHICPVPYNSPPPYFFKPDNVYIK